jgi:hypothetical protein
MESNASALFDTLLLHSRHNSARARPARAKLFKENGPVFREFLGTPRAANISAARHVSC